MRVVSSFIGKLLSRCVLSLCFHRTSCIRGTASHVPRAPGNQDDILCISTSALKHKSQYDTRCDTSPGDLPTTFTAQSLPKLAMTMFFCQESDFSPGCHKPSHLATIMCTTHMQVLAASFFLLSNPVQSMDRHHRAAGKTEPQDGRPTSLQRS